MPQLRLIFAGAGLWLHSVAFLDYNKFGDHDFHLLVFCSWVVRRHAGIKGGLFCACAMESRVDVVCRR